MLKKLLNTENEKSQVVGMGFFSSTSNQNSPKVEPKSESFVDKLTGAIGSFFELDEAPSPCALEKYADNFAEGIIDKLLKDQNQDNCCCSLSWKVDGNFINDLKKEIMKRVNEALHNLPEKNPTLFSVICKNAKKDAKYLGGNLLSIADEGLTLRFTDENCSVTGSKKIIRSINFNQQFCTVVSLDTFIRDFYTEKYKLTIGLSPTLGINHHTLENLLPSYSPFDID